MKPFLIFDIETGALPLEQIKALGIMPTFKAPANYKDPEKIKAKEAEHEAEVMDRAALDPTISKVLAGLWSPRMRARTLKKGSI